MIRFAALFTIIDATTKTNEKLRALINYFCTSSFADSAWATYFLCGYKLKQIIPTKLLRTWAAEEAEVPTWLFDEAYHSVGDLAETITLIVPSGQLADDVSLAEWVEERLWRNDSSVKSRASLVWFTLDFQGDAKAQVTSKPVAVDRKSVV